MGATIFTVANRKGGISKSSTGLFLATALAHTKRKVLFLDCDSQASAYEYRQFEKGMPHYKDAPEPYRILKKDPAYLLEEIQDYSSQYDIIFIDIPRFTHGKDDKMMIAILAMCDSILIPIKSGELDNLSTLGFVKTIKEIAAFKKEKGKKYKYAGFLSMTGRRPTDDADSREFIKDLDVPLLDNELKDVRELSNPYTYDSLLNLTKSEKERFEPFYNEVVQFFNL
jgi:chromosome partitioning protein